MTKDWTAKINALLLEIRKYDARAKQRKDNEEGKK